MNKPLVLSSTAAVLIAGVALTTTRSAEIDTAMLRSEAKLMFGVIPDRMPGAENDTPERVALGRKLYFDNRLSANETQSCNSCHRVDENLAGVDNEVTSDGAFKKQGDRNARPRPVRLPDLVWRRLPFQMIENGLHRCQAPPGKRPRSIPCGRLRRAVPR